MKRNRNFIPILATSVLILGSGVGLELLFNRYMYLPLFMLAQLLFLLGISTVLLALFSLIPPPAESVEKTETEETAAEETAVEERTKPSPLAAVGGFFRSIGRGIRRFFGGLWQWICRRSGLLVLLALTGDEAAAGYDTVRGTASVDADTGANHFVPDGAARHAYVVKKQPDGWYAEQINSLL